MPPPPVLPRPPAGDLLSLDVGSAPAAVAPPPLSVGNNDLLMLDLAGPQPPPPASSSQPLLLDLAGLDTLVDRTMPAHALPARPLPASENALLLSFDSPQ